MDSMNFNILLSIDKFNIWTFGTTFPNYSKGGIGDIFLPWRPHVTYLDLILDRWLSFRQHIDKKLQLGNILFRKLYPVLTTKLLPVKTRTLIFTAILRAHLTYAAPVWFPLLSETGKRRVTSHHNRLSW
jgi:hypothetical protein